MAEKLNFPPLLIVMSAGLLFGTGASALIARELGKAFFMPFRILSMAFHLLLITAERPGFVLVAVVCFLQWRKREQSGDLPEPDESEQE